MAESGSNAILGREMLHRARVCALAAARACGLTSLAMRTGWRRNRLLILAWHGISIDDEHAWDARLFLPAAQFRRRLELIAEAGCNVLPLDTAVRLLYRGELPPRTVALTFDDGLFDFYSVAYPVLQDFGFPVTVYLTTYYANFNRPVYNVMASYLLWKGRGRILHWPEVLGPEAVELSGPAIVGAADRFEAYAAEEGLSGAEKDALLCRLAEHLEVDYGFILKRRILHLMTIDEARDLASRGVDFQLHTHRHYVSLDRALFERELADNQAWLSRIRTGKPAHFCYPSGVYRAEFFPWLRDFGILSATTCEPGIASRGANPLLLPRLVDSTFLTESGFLGWLSGIAALLPREATWQSVVRPPEELMRKPKAAPATAAKL